MPTKDNEQSINKESSLSAKVEAAKSMVAIFQPERYTHLVIAILCCLVLLFLGVFSYIKERLDWASLMALFLPAGGITYSASRILTMFTQCLEFLKK